MPKGYTETKKSLLDLVKTHTWVSMEASNYVVSKLGYFTYLGDEINLLILGLGHPVTKYQ